MGDDKPFASTGPQGHRGRMRAKLLDRGPDALADYELLEMLLFLGLPRGDTKPLAKSLMNRFGSLARMFSAPDAALAEAGLNGPNRALVGLAAEFGSRLAQPDADDRPHLGTIEQISRFLRSGVGAAGRDSLAVLHLNSRNRLVRDQRLPAETEAVAVAKAMGEEAVRHHASAAVIVALRAGRPRCTPHDRDVARECRNASKALSITLHDYVVIGTSDEISLRQAGFL